MSKRSDYVYFAAFNYSMCAFLLIGSFRSFFEGEIDSGYGLIAASTVPAACGTYCVKKISD